MMEEWKHWCRLCACDGIHQVDIFLKEIENNPSIAEDLKRLCNIKLENATDLPSKICNNCKLNIRNLKEFVINSIKAQQMFTEFQCNQTSDYYNLRKKYKLSNDTQIKEENDIYEQLDSSFNCDLKDTINTNIEERKEQIIEHEFIQKTNTNKTVFLKSFVDENLLDDNCDNESFSSSKEIDNEIEYSSINNSKKNFEINESNNCILNENDINYIKTEENDLHKDIKKIFKENKSKFVKDGKISIIKFRCKVCEKDFSSQGGLTTHLKIKHSIAKDPHTCKFCGKKFERLSRLENHENAHLPSEERKQLSCPHCDKKFNSESGRWSHIHSVHDKKKAVICEECGKEFSTKHHLVKHKISHTQEKNLQCPSCPARFKGKVGLAAHMEIHGESFPCSICGVLLNTKQLLKKHMIVHSDVKNFKCNFCNKFFKRSKELNYHLITHIGIKPFECRICNQKFVHDMTYRRHLKATHPTQFAEMVAKGEKISCRNFPPPEQLKAINEAAKNTQNNIDS